jgi:peptidoglycan hydrolase-like protein with peptidoglycan-binding domain
MRSPTSRSVLVGTATALLVGLTAGVASQAADPSPPPQQASLPANGTTASPPLPLGDDDVREVQNQLIALGFDPGPADGQVGPATTSAAQQYDQSRGGTGGVSIDSALLARLKADAAPRLTYEQVAERSRTRQRPSAPASASVSNQIGGIVQQIVPLIGAAIANSNNNRYGPDYYGYGPDPYYGRRYYAPQPHYYRHGYGFF